MNELENKILNALIRVKRPMERGALKNAVKCSFSELDAAVSALVDSGSIIITGRGKIATSKNAGFKIGRIDAYEKGFAFLVSPDDPGKDVFIPRNSIGNALNGDIVQIKLTNTRAYRGKAEGEVVRIIEPRSDTVVGKIIVTRKIAIIEPDDRRLPDMRVEQANICGAQTGDMVVAQITRRANQHHGCEARVTEVLGRAGDTGTSILAIMRSYGIKDEFSPRAMHQAESEPQVVTEQDVLGREDLRELFTVTIDGDDARDFDDAISLKKDENGYILYVHIADVSNYVQPDSVIDREAVERGTSVYFPDRVSPMLPLELSNGICSLNEGVDRLTLTCEAHLTRSGQTESYRFYKSVIRSDKRCTYNAVNAILERNEAPDGYSADNISRLMEMGELYGNMARLRSLRGSIDFDLPEAYIVTGTDGEPTEILEAERGDANRMIEEFMLCANECAAKFGKQNELPFLYRVHEDPDAEKIGTFFTMVKALGLEAPSGIKPTPKQLQKLLDAAAESPYYAVINRVMLRSMQKAHYSAEPTGHFGLALKNYCHFTSPIRRYPDLVVHRAIKAEIDGGEASKRWEAMGDEVKRLAVLTSNREKNAMEAERAVDDYLKAVYMEKHIGETYEGVITSVLEFGVFVALKNTVEGLVHTAELGDEYFDYDPKLYRLTGSKSKRIYGIGDKMNVLVSAVDPEARRVDFVPYTGGELDG
ncbi:MAG: ribonuclease R [Lawsonibacter sp.]|nr:ribonuclease R [Lawsonibacter sp.]